MKFLCTKCILLRAAVAKRVLRSGGMLAELPLHLALAAIRPRNHFHSFIFFIPHSIDHAAPLRRRVKFVRHEKEWMKRKRLKAERRYFRLQEGIEELKTYIKFIQENKRH